VEFDDKCRSIMNRAEVPGARVWDAGTEACREVIPDAGDSAALAADATAVPWRAERHAIETPIEATAGGVSLAWFPAALGDITRVPAGWVRAGSARNHHDTVWLDGEPERKPEEGAKQ
jgi:hypothetical protein